MLTNVVLMHQSVVVGRSFTPQAHDSLKSIPEKVSGVQITVPRPLLDATGYVLIQQQCLGI